MIDRMAVYNKYNGHCAYCGRELKLKEMQVDHIHPQHLIKEFILSGSGMIDDLQNLNPSCRSCNHYKSTFDIELFRSELERQPEIQGRKSQIRLCQRFGIIKFSNEPIKFYFEQSERHPNE
jgi:5-methylcytosine-specific restriction endonuclease McrA